MSKGVCWCVCWTYGGSVCVCSSVSSSCWGQPWTETPPSLCPDWTLWRNPGSWSEWARDGPAPPGRQMWRCSLRPHTARFTRFTRVSWKVKVRRPGRYSLRRHLERLVSAVGQHVPLQPALAGGRRVVHLAALPQTHKHLCDRQAHTPITNRHPDGAAGVWLPENKRPLKVPSADFLLLWCDRRCSDCKAL